MRVVLDSNILIDYLTGVTSARNVPQQYTECFVSRIAWIEVMADAKDTTDQARIGQFLQIFPIIELDEKISTLSIDLRRQHRLKLPDAIIWATAKSLGCLLLTLDKNYPASMDIHWPY